MSTTVRIGFTGVAGSYSEAAVRALYAGHPDFKGKELVSVSFPTDEQLLAAVSLSEVDQAITPIENSHSGTLHEVLTLLLDARCKPALAIAAEFTYHEPHQLLGLPGATTSNARQVISHEHVLRQCDVFLDAVLPTWQANRNVGCQRVMASSTGAAAEWVYASQDPTLICVAGHTAADIYGLVPVKVDTNEERSTQMRIETHSESAFTRFWLIGREDNVKPVERHQEPKTSIGMRTQNRPGVLHRALGCFATRNINVYKIESRPQTRSIQQAFTTWSYDMYIDFEGAPSVDASVGRALDNLREFATEVTVLGSYPRLVLEEQFW
ncbi:Prephenate dehydratase [Syncephalis fuscata]|nr:Prephenate dehydratase [Syncephalis fuscata]